MNAIDPLSNSQEVSNDGFVSSSSAEAGKFTDLDELHESNRGYDSIVAAASEADTYRAGPVFQEQEISDQSVAIVRPGPHSPTPGWSSWRSLQKSVYFFFFWSFVWSRFMPK